MGAHWFGACPRPYGAERTQLLPPAELDLALAEAERLLEVEVHGLHNEVSAWIRRRLNGALGQGRPPGRRIQEMPLAAQAAAGGVRRSGSDTILRPVLDGSARVELRPGTLCRRVLMDGGRAAGVELVDLASHAVTVVRARHVVVACDGLRTPQLLFASGVRPAALGTHLNEHMQFAATVRLDDAPRGLPWVRQPGDFTMLTDHGHLVALSEPGVTWLPYVDEVFPYSGQIAVIDPDSLAEPAGDAPVATVHLFAAKDVQAADRLGFSPVHTDRLGLPAMRVCYNFTGRDRTTQRRARQAVDEVVRVLGSPLDHEPAASLPVGSSLHYQGTVRMGATPAGSVCDRSSLVWGTENLRVAGNGVIATPTACNPTLTSAAHATIGARAIAADLAG